MQYAISNEANGGIVNFSNKVDNASHVELTKEHLDQRGASLHARPCRPVEQRSRLSSFNFQSPSRFSS